MEAGDKGVGVILYLGLVLFRQGLMWLTVLVHSLLL